MTIQTEFYVVGTNRTTPLNAALNSMKLKGSDRTALYVDFNITFTKMPCNYLTVDYYDVFGTRDLDINDKIKLNTFGKQDGHVSSTRDRYRHPRDVVCFKSIRGQGRSARSHAERRTDHHRTQGFGGDGKGRRKGERDTSLCCCDQDR